MPCCAVATCSNYNQNTKGTEIKYFRFPKHSDFAKQWVAACRRKDNINLKNACICSNHFEASCFQISLQHRLLNYMPKNCRNLKPDAIPTLNLPKTTQTKGNTGRSLRFQKRARRSKINELLSTASGAKKPIVEESQNESLSNVRVDTIDQAEEINCGSEMEKMMKRIKALERDNAELKKKVVDVAKSTAMHYESALAKIFTPGQIRKILDPVKGRKMRWSPKDIASAFALHSVSPKAYSYLKTHQYPLPDISTLKSWGSKQKGKQIRNAD